MVVALKEVKIRGEIRTTVDYCVEMIQSPDFVGNNIHTGWLDARISSHVGAPPLHVLCTTRSGGRLARCFHDMCGEQHPHRLGGEGIPSHVDAPPLQHRQQQQPC